MFAKPTGLGVDAGIIGNSPQHIIMLARDMFDNDPIAGAVVETIAGIPFGNHSLSGMPDKKHLEPYLRSLDRIRVKTLLPVLATTFMVDGAFLGTGVFNAADRVYDAIIPQDVQQAEITPVPFFGATPIIDVHISPEQARMLSKAGDKRMDRYRRLLPAEFARGGRIQLQPESTFYIPRRTIASVPLGTSMFRKIMTTYILEKALTRGTVEMAYRRQRPIIHIAAGDENWDPSQAEMQELSDLFLAADLDPIGAVVVTRQGVSPQEVGGAQDAWRWTDSVDILTSIKLKGLGMPDGLLGGDMALDSVSATLTVFINMMRAFRDYITRLFFYEKMFPYIAIANDHRRDTLGAFQSTGSNAFSGNTRYFSRAADVEDVDVGEYMFPTVAWHSSMRPEGDKEYMEMLQETAQAGVPIPIRMLAAAGGLDINDILNSADDDLEIRGRVAAYTAQVQAMEQAQGGGRQDEDRYDEGAAEDVIRAMNPVRRKGILGRDYGDRAAPVNEINGHRYVQTARERKRIEEKANRLIAEASVNVHARLRSMLARQEVAPGKPPLALPSTFGVQ
jgi:hypothetical protein